MWKRKGEIKEEKKELSLLEELCKDDPELHDCLSGYLFVNPLAGISKKDIDTLIGEGEKSGDFRPAMDKAIFEGSQNPGEREKYIKVIQNLALKTIHATEHKIEQAEKEGLTDQAASLKGVIKKQQFLSERAGDVLNTASRYYNEELVEQGEKGRKLERATKRSNAEAEEWIKSQEETKRREAAKKERREMGKEARVEAEKQERKDEMAAEERREARTLERKEAEKEEEMIDEREKEEREARKKERMKS